MRNKVHDVLRVVGRDAVGIGEAIPHAIDGAYDGGKIGKDKRHRVKMALHRLRLRASGMTDAISGSKEVSGSLEDPFEQVPKE
jgi:hypothetical protein